MILELKTVIKRGINWLLSQQRSDGAFSLNDGSLWDVWNTVNAGLTLWEVSPENQESIQKAKDYLYSNYLGNGKFFHGNQIDIFQKHKEKVTLYCVETTAMCIRFLIRSFCSKEDLLIIKEICNFLSKEQQPDGSWISGNCLPENYLSFPSITGYVIIAFSEILKRKELFCEIFRNSAKFMKRIKKGIHFLKQSQNSHGSWGIAYAYYGTSYYPIESNLTALISFKLNHSISIFKTLGYLEMSQDEDGGWGKQEMKHFESSSISRNIRTALALQSLSLFGQRTSIIEKGVLWLINSRKQEGANSCFWEGGHFFSNNNKWYNKNFKEDIFATSRSLLALRTYIDILTTRKKYV